MTTTHLVRTRIYQTFLFGVMGAAMAFFPLSGAYADNNSKSSMQTGTGVEVNIGSNGGVLVRGAKVTSVSGSTVNANTSLGSSVLNWVVKTDGDTEFVTHGGANTGLAGIAVGDIISFRGSIDQAVSSLTVNAKVVKDWSSVETRKSISGIVSSISTTLNSFTVSKNGSTSSPQATTVQTSSSTIFKKDGENASFADIVINAKVKVLGLLNASTSVFTATSVAIDSDDDNDRHRFRGWFNGGAWFKFWR